MHRFEDDTDDLIRTVLKSEQYAKFQTKRAVGKRIRRSGCGPLR